MRVSIDRAGCIACGLCEQTCPEVFELAEDGLAAVREQPDEAMEALAKTAADSCPVSVIHVEED